MRYSPKYNALIFMSGERVVHETGTGTFLTYLGANNELQEFAEVARVNLDKTGIEEVESRSLLPQSNTVWIRMGQSIGHPLISDKWGRIESHSDDYSWVAIQFEDGEKLVLSPSELFKKRS